MSTYFLIRHELLRHECIRYFSLTLNDFNCPKYIVDNGMYYEPTLKRIYCFSCHFNLAYTSNYIHLYELHRKKSEDCPFLNGKDVSIKTPTKFYGMIRLGWPNEVDLSVLNREIGWEYVSERSLTFPPVKLRWSSDNIRCLCSFFSPCLIPFYGNDNTILDVDYYFKMLTSLDTRMKTFYLEGHRFPYSDLTISIFARMGFFYTLYNVAIQCHSCRLVLNGRHTETVVRHYHKQFSPNCTFIYDSETIIFPGFTIALPQMPTQSIEEEEKEEEGSNTKCAVCWVRKKTHFAHPCMHLSHCERCLVVGGVPTRCVICKTESVTFHKLYV